MLPALRSGVWTGVLLSLSAWAGTAWAKEGEGTAIEIPFEKYELPNGLQVILSPDRSVPFVYTNVWYYVGSRDEVSGRTGFAHLYEHMMFQGSEHADDDYFQPLQRIGGQVNGTTNLDRTNFFEGVPSRWLLLSLFLESDRMGWLLPAMTQEKLDNQKQVVRNERRQRYENRPYGNAWVYLLQNMYPDGHPYQHATIGRHEDIDAATLQDVQDFFRKWYLPNNASLVVCGDYDRDSTVKAVADYFGEIPAGPEPEAVEPDAVSLAEQKVARYQEDVPFPKVWIAWHTPRALTKEDAGMDLISSILADGKDSPFYQELVFNLQVSQDVEAYQSSSRYGSMFVIESTAAAGHTGDEVVAAIDSILSRYRASGFTGEELSIARTGYMVQFYDSLASIQGKANLLNHYNYLTGDPGYIGEDLSRYYAVKTGWLKRLYKKWLPLDRRLVMHIDPKAPAAPAAPAGGGK